MLGLAAVKAGKTDEARQQFQRLLSDRDTPPSIAERARIMMAMLTEAELSTRRRHPRRRARRPRRPRKRNRPAVRPQPERKTMGGKRGLGGNGLGSVTAALFGVVLLSGCEGASLPSLPKFQDINPFAEKEVPLPGKRISVIQQENIASDLAAANKPISLPPPRQNDAWSQPGGVANNSPGHLMLGGALKSAWSADAGTGSSFYGKLTASPDRL